MIRAYNKETARELVPLLETILREINERTHEIHVLQGRLQALGKTRARAAALEACELRAAIASHKRELRLAHAEIARLGCVLDKSRPQRVLIPGVDGKLEGGYSWDGAKSGISLVAQPSAA